MPSGLPNSCKMQELAVLLLLQGCILWHNWWPLLTGRVSCFDCMCISIHLALSHIAADCDIMAYCLQRSCMCLCQCLTYSLGQTPHPQVQYMEAAAWPAGERLALRCLLFQLQTTQHTSAHVKMILGIQLWCLLVSCCSEYICEATPAQGYLANLIDHADSNTASLSSCYCLHANLCIIPVARICPCQSACCCRWVDAGKFLTGFSAIGSVAVPAILFHAQVQS